MSNIRVRLKPKQGIKWGLHTTYLFDPDVITEYTDLAKDWAIKDTGKVNEEGVDIDYSAKAYAIGGVGTETNNAKYYSQQSGLSATSASDSATTATTQAGIATTKAGEASDSATTAGGYATTATTQAGIATSKATEAGNSATLASGYATTATTQAGIATSKAGEASNSATTASGHASTATTQAGIATSKAGEASNSATLASGSALASAASAALSEQWAIGEPTEPEGGSAKYWAGQSQAGQVQSDWAEVDTTAKSYIKNKPALATVATSGDYDDLVDKPTIGDGTITLTQGGVSKGTFTVNQSGNTTIDFDAITIDQVYDATSANAQSGVAINGAKFTQNTATGTGALTINGTAATAQYAVNLGTSSSAGNSAVAVGYHTAANGVRSVSIGYNARIGASTADAIQIGCGTNSTACSFYVGFYNDSTTHYNWQLLDGLTGYIPGERLNLKTVNGTSLLGSGDVTVDSLPSQTGQAGKFLTTDGTDASWASVGQGMPIGTIYALSCSASYVPEGSLPLDGTQYTKAQFTDLWNNYLTGNDPLLLTCSYADYASDISTYGQCIRWAVDTVNETFKVPTIKDGSFIQQALSDSELGKCYKAGVPNITGSITKQWVSRTATVTGAFLNSTKPTTGSGSPGTGGDANVTGVLDFDASNSSSIYGNSNTVQPEAVSLRYFVVVANGEINESMMDWAAWASSLSGKLNTDGSNLGTGTGQGTVRAVVETYVNGTSWYRIYSDGWCEQGGFITMSSTSGNVYFFKPFVDTNYTIMTTAQRDRHAYQTVVTARNTHYFSWLVDLITGYTGTMWTACGYIS